MVDEALLRQSLQSLRNDPDRLIEIVMAQAVLIEELRAEIERLKRDNDDLQRRSRLLEQRLEQLEHDAHRSAAPFRVPEKKRKDNPKKPGRKKGHRGTFRARPDHIDQQIDVPLQACPRCGGPVCGVIACEQFIEEIPPVRPVVTRLVTYEGQCPRCGEVRSTHPLQVSTATGAAATQLGPRALGVALDLNRRLGLTARKTCAVLKSLCGLRLSPGGLVQAAHRMAQRLEPRHQQIEQAVRTADHIHADETSWWVGGPGWWLWVFANQDHTLYRVRPGRGRDVVHETLGADFPGVLVSDCLNIYDDATPVQHKCYAHHLKAISQAIERCPQDGAGLLRQIEGLLRLAMTLKSLWPELSDQEKQAARSSTAACPVRLARAPRSSRASRHSEAPDQTGRPSVHLPRSRPRGRNQQSGRTPAAPRRHRAQTLVRQSHGPRRAHLGSARLPGLQRNAIQKGFPRHRRQSRHSLSIRCALNTYDPFGVPLIACSFPRVPALLRRFGHPGLFMV